MQMIGQPKGRSLLVMECNISCRFVNMEVTTNYANQGFHKLDEMGNNANIGIKDFTT